jgi:hypothetical protein
MEPSNGLISARSRRLRAAGVVLLLLTLGMALYGALGLMPSVRQSVRTYNERAYRLMDGGAGRSVALGEVAEPGNEDPVRVRRAVRVQVLFAYGYWLVCGILLLILLFVAWLDFREVTRNYLLKRAALFRDSRPGGSDPE